MNVARAATRRWRRRASFAGMQFSNQIVWTATVAKAVLTISSKNYSSWCLRGWLMCKLAGLAFAEEEVPVEDPAARAELLLLSPSFLVPCLRHDGAKVW